MNLLPFRFEAPTAIEERPPSIDITLWKEGRARRYRIRRGKEEGSWYAQVFFAQTQHRAAIVHSLVEAQRLYAEFTREIAAAREDGWESRSSPPSL